MKFSLFSAVALFGLCSSASILQDQINFNVRNADSNEPAPVIAGQNSKVIPGEYIVMLNDQSVSTITDMKSFVSSVVPEQESILHVYTDGFAAKISQETLENIRRRPEVAFVEPNSVVSINAVQNNPPSWGLARIFQKTFTIKNQYVYQDSAGSDIDAYVIDTGVYVNHVDFERRAVWGITTAAGEDDTDGNGHGTHVAGTIAGASFGVAKKANIIAVKVLNAGGTGSMADVIAGVQWAAAQTTSKRRKSVANMSLGGGRSPSLDRAVTNAIAAGLHFVVAAGNSNTDACKSSPAAVPLAITVGASTSDDARAYFSNFGKCVDIFGPGMSIRSIWITSPTSTRILSGTSMASPHVAGVAALLLADNDYTPAQLKAKIEAVSFKGLLTGLPSSTVNRLLNNNAVTKSNEFQVLYY